MTALVVVALCGFSVSLLTLFSGFGLGTLLLPAFAIFLPVEVAVASTAIVHAANNLFKVGLLARSIRRDILVRFGLPAACAALAGALTLVSISTQSGLATWSFLGRAAEVTPVKLVMGILILFFAAVELATPRREWGVSPRWLPVGGALSGFFGGLSGHQGAVRAVFLTPLRLSPVQFASTQAGLALLVDGTRLIVYGWSFALMRSSAGPAVIPWTLVVVATVSAFTGSLLGTYLLPHVTLDSVHRFVGGLLIVVGLALAAGIA